MVPLLAALELTHRERRFVDFSQMRHFPEEGG